MIIVVLEMEVGVDSDTGEKGEQWHTYIGQMVMRWRSDQSYQSDPSQVEVREAEGVSRKPGSAA